MVCCSCSMWELRDDDDSCGKCSQLQLLGDRVRELELGLNGLRVIRAAEHIIDKSVSEVFAPKVQADSSWVTTRKDKGSRQREQEAPVAIPFKNKYIVLKQQGAGLDEHSRPSSIIGAE
eukprot:g13538.t1